MDMTKEIVFHRLIPKNYLGLSSVELDGIERVGITKLLEIWKQNDMGTWKQIEHLTSICNQQLYLLNQIREEQESAGGSCFSSDCPVQYFICTWGILFKPFSYKCINIFSSTK